MIKLEYSSSKNKKKLYNSLRYKSLIPKHFIIKNEINLITHVDVLFFIFKKYKFKNHKILIIKFNELDILTTITNDIDIDIDLGSYINADLCIIKNISFNPYFIKKSLISEKYDIYINPTDKFIINQENQKQFYQCFGYPIPFNIIDDIIEDYIYNFGEDISKEEAYEIFVLLNYSEIFICDDDYIKNIKKKFPQKIKTLNKYIFITQKIFNISQEITFNFSKKKIYIFYYIKINSTPFHQIESSKVKKYLINVYSFIYFYVILGGEL